MTHYTMCAYFYKFSVPNFILFCRSNSFLVAFLKNTTKTEKASEKNKKLT